MGDYIGSVIGLLEGDIRSFHNGSCMRIRKKYCIAPGLMKSWYVKGLEF